MIRRTTVDELATSAARLFVEHWEEAGDGGPISPQWARYRAAEEAGALLCLAAFSDVGVMVGYSVNLLIAHAHTGEITASNDLVFVTKAHRPKGVGMALIRATERESAADGAVAVIWRGKVGGPVDVLMQALNREVYEHAYRVKVKP